jgi:signal transduction histidine kinase
MTIHTIQNLTDLVVPSVPVPFGTWFLMAVFAVLLVWGLIYLAKTGYKLDKKQIIALAIAVLILVPVNWLGIKAKIYALDIATFFATPAFFIGFLHIALIVFVLGFVGLIPGFLLGFLTGLVQVLLQKQDPAVIILYAAIPIVLAKYLTFPQIQRPVWRGTKSWVYVLLSWISLVPLVLILYATRAFFLRLPFEWVVLRYCLFLWLSFLPAFVLAALGFWVMQKWYLHAWRLPESIKTVTDKNEMSPIIEQIRRLSGGNYDLEILSKPSQKGERQLYQALETLRKNLLFRHEAQSRLLSLDPSHYSKEGYDLILSSVLKAALTRDASSARLLLLDEHEKGQPLHIRSRFGQGENTRLFAYLDGTILDKIGSQEQLILTDIKVDQYFGLSAGSPFPQSIIALPLNDKGRTHGILWVGFEQKKWFSPDDIKFYQELAFRASVAMSTKQETLQLMNDKHSYEASLNAIPHAIFVLNENREITFLNKSAKVLAGKADGLLALNNGKHAFVHPKILDLLKDNSSQQVYDSGIQFGNGASFDLEIYPLIEEDKTVGNVVLFVDQAWLSQINQQRTEFISNISHDLQSPIKMIKGHLILLERMGNLNKEQQTYVKLIEDHTESMNRLVNKMLNLEKLDVVQTLNYSRFDFQQKTDDVVKLLSHSAQQKKISVQQDYSKMATPYISADPTLIQQAMYNLIENAIKYSPLGGKVLVSAEKDASILHIIVQDEGKGIAPIDQPSLFNRFFHLNEDESFENNVQGLGLAIVKSIAEKHGGSIHVESQLGEGSKFYLDIPIHKLS